MKVGCLILAFAALSLMMPHQAIGQEQNAKTVSEILLGSITERSPYIRHQNKDYSPEIKIFGLDPRCATEDLKNLFLLQRPPMKADFPHRESIVKDEVEHIRTRDLSIKISEFEDVVARELGFQLDLFNNLGDPKTDKRELCIDAVSFERPNAVSIGLGFLAFDPKLFFQLVRSEHANDWSLKAVIAHEFAHQLQIWHQDPSVFKLKENRVYVRDKELQADCVAAGILSQMTDEDDSQAEVLTALGSAFSSLGDFEIGHYEGHHGTAWERALMVNIGASKATELNAGSELNSGRLLMACSDYINKMNARFGEQLWPMGSRLEP